MLYITEAGGERKPPDERGWIGVKKLLE